MSPRRPPEGEISPDWAREEWTQGELDALHEILRPDKIDRINHALKTYETLMSVGRFNAWLIGAIIAIFIGFVAFGDAFRKMMGWMGK